MEASTSSALTPLLHAADAWQEVALLLPVLIGLEIVLSADNAIALAAIAAGTGDISLKAVTGDITDHGDTHVEVVGGSLRMLAGGNIGEAAGSNYGHLDTS